MATTVGQMSKKELSELVSKLIEQKLREIMIDTEDDLELQPKIRERLRRQKKAVARGERGKDFNEVVRN